MERTTSERQPWGGLIGNTNILIELFRLKQQKYFIIITI